VIAYTIRGTCKYDFFLGLVFNVSNCDVFCNLIIFSDYIIANQQGVKHWRYFIVCNEHVEENTPFNVDVRKKGFVSAKCIMCESLKDLISKLGRNYHYVREYELKLKKHLLHQKLVPYLEV
jgi:hypothetical protein